MHADMPDFVPLTLLAVTRLLLNIKERCTQLKKKSLRPLGVGWRASSLMAWVPCHYLSHSA